MRFWPFEKSDVPAVASAADPVPGFIYCCKGNIGLSFAYVRATWSHVGTQHDPTGVADLEMWTCPSCGTTKSIEVPCPGGPDHSSPSDLAVRS